MDQRALYAKTLRYQKTGVDVLFNLVATVQRGGQSLVAQSLENATWLPKSSKKSLISLFEQFSQNTKTLKDSVDQGYEGMNQLFSAEHKVSANKVPSASVRKAGASSDKGEEGRAPTEAAAEPAAAKAPRPKSVTAVKHTARAKAVPQKSRTRAKAVEKVAVAAKTLGKKDLSLGASQPAAGAIKDKKSAALTGADNLASDKPQQQLAAPQKSPEIEQGQAKAESIAPEKKGL